MDSGHRAVAALLANERLNAPAQLVYRDAASDTVIWFGDEVGRRYLMFHIDLTTW